VFSIDTPPVVDSPVSETSEVDGNPSKSASANTGYNEDHVNLNHEQKLATENNCICNTQLLHDLVTNFKCKNKGCTAKVKVDNSINVGSSIKLSWSCSEGHTGTWISSRYINSHNVVNFLLIIATLFSGGGYIQLSLFCQVLCIGCISKNFFYQVQRLFVHPVVVSEANSQMNHLRNDCVGERVVCGDGRADSPGYSAMKLTYSFLDHETGHIVHSVTVDKREVDNKSPRMEKEACQRGLTTLENSQYKIGELVTDEHSSIKKMMKVQFSSIKHSLDIWHKSKKISEKLADLGRKKVNRELLPWIPDVRNHFWHAASSCKGNVMRFLRTWVSIMHHIQGKHKWLGGKCSHGPMAAPQQGQSYLKFGSPAYNALRQIAFDKKLLRSAGYYVNSRVTYQLESFHNLILKYCPKRIGYRRSYQMRIALAILDHNNHTKLCPRIGPGGDPIMTRKYSKSSRQYTVKPVKEKKCYKYLHGIVAKILYTTTPGCQTTVKEYQPLLPISGIKPPLTESLLQSQRSRFVNDKHRPPQPNSKIPQHVNN
jgi:hypothetical protein